jgi:hypothetical protein
MAAVLIVTDTNLKSENVIVATCLRFHIRVFWILNTEMTGPKPTLFTFGKGSYFCNTL